MKVFVTGHLGYIGTVMTPMLLRPDTRSSAATAISMSAARSSRAATSSTCRPSSRTCATLERADLKGIDAVIHLAALSNDPLGDLNPGIDLQHQSSRQRAPGRSSPSRPASSASCSPPRAATTARRARA